nr:MAG TPA_asm: hypothetical protein [Caudoviricetes sp.]
MHNSKTLHLFKILNKKIDIFLNLLFNKLNFIV